MPKPRCKPASGIKDTLESQSLRLLVNARRLPGCPNGKLSLVRRPRNTNGPVYNWAATAEQVRYASGSCIAKGELPW